MRSIFFFAAALVAAVDARPESIDARWYRMTSRLVPRQKPVTAVQQPITPPTIDVPTIQGCFKSAGDLELNTTHKFNSIGKCADETCREGGFAVGGSMGGNQCWCGQTYPPKSDLVDPSFCNSPCSGFGEHACGGIEYWTIYNTGLTLVVKHKDADPSSTSGTPSSTSGPDKTTVVTATPTGSSEGGTNVGGIVAGVVVGIVLAAAAVGGVVFYLRRKRNKELEEEHRRNAAVNAFIGKPGSSAGSITDSRLDPVMVQRRLSDGSIADNQDYSRRILRVTNA